MFSLSISFVLFRLFGSFPHCLHVSTLRIHILFNIRLVSIYVDENRSIQTVSTRCQHRFPIICMKRETKCVQTSTQFMKKARKYLRKNPMIQKCRAYERVWKYFESFLQMVQALSVNIFLLWLSSSNYVLALQFK